MAEEATTEPTNSGEGKTFTQAELDAIVRDRLSRERSKFGDYDDLKQKASKLDEISNASRSDIERLSSESNSLKGENGSLKGENMRLKVALKKGLTGDKAVLAGRLSGTTEAEMEADADELLKLFGGGSTGFDGGTRGRGDDTPRSMDALIRRASGRNG